MMAALYAKENPKPKVAGPGRGHKNNPPPGAEAFPHIPPAQAESAGLMNVSRKAVDKAFAYWLHRLGWIQEEIAKAIGMETHGHIKEILSEFPELEKGTKSLLKSGLPHTEVAQRFNLPLIELEII
jgi:hypothetical protein